MNCPYCLTEVQSEALVCKTCTRDLYLLKPMMVRVSELEQELSNIPNQDALKGRIAELELLIEEHTRTHLARGFIAWVGDIFRYLVLPLLFLLLAHLLISVVYDTKMIYLRIISMALPMPFAYFLFKTYPHKLFPWFCGVVVLAISSVLGMSWITSLVDHSPVFPQSMFEWKEVLEYSASIAFSFLTGMLLGRITYNKRRTNLHASVMDPYLKALAHGLQEEGLSIDSVHDLMKKLQEYGGTIVALGTTVLSIYTGLKGIIGV
ncbi:hypothetical protein G6705_03875 [Polynucleobacter paneuropaeus]|nr:hypothetical protein [Polynucleobacter paneuropaeus]MBT8584409.1 hypothetical protein [Polynucleobacter paneuropaeus]